ncbi:purine-cytosine permease family protein, partial [Kitasatospora sp. NPDC002543]
APAVEQHTIDHVPENERHGRVRDLFTMWFGTNIAPLPLVTGAMGVQVFHQSFWSSVAAILVGQLVGAVFMALHSAQGPRLGLPQMIQSRAQFGVRGAVVPLLLVILMYIGFFASGSVLAGQAVGELTHTGDTTGIVVFALVTGAMATVGYRVIHALGRVASIVCAIAFVYLGIRLLDRVDLSALLHDAHFDAPMFLLAISLSASWQLAFGPYVADYSRYLPRTTSAKSTFWWTLSGSAIGSQWSMTFGVLVAATAGAKFLDNQVSYVVGLGGAGIIASFLYFVIALGKLTINVLNTYGGFMSMVTSVSGFRGQKVLSQRARAVYIALIMIAGTAVALVGKDSFLSSFKDFLLFLLTFFTPWSAINLVDYYLISKERYDIPALSDPHGRYGAWRWDALTVYVVGLLAQLPFLAT